MRANRVPYAIATPNNMGVVRYVLAFAVVISHFNDLTGFEVESYMSVYNAVGGFFALSGFLMIGSYMKAKSLRSYILNRCRRLLPAYWATVLIFAVGLSLLSVTNSYFTNVEFYEYLGANLSFMNFLKPELPGVFEGNLTHAVNGSLWTMKVELMLYLSVPVVTVALMKWRRHPLAVLVSIYILSSVYRLYFIHLYDVTGAKIYEILSRQFAGQMMYFYMGGIVYYYFDVFKRYRWWIIAIAMTTQLCFKDVAYYGVTIEPMMISLIVLWFSMTGRWGTFEGKRDNISYNIYLVHFPVIQIMAATGVTAALGAGWGLAVCVAVTVALAWFINMTVERPILRRVRKLR